MSQYLFFTCAYNNVTSYSHVSAFILMWSHRHPFIQLKGSTDSWEGKCSKNVSEVVRTVCALLRTQWWNYHTLVFLEIKRLRFQFNGFSIELFYLFGFYQYFTLIILNLIIQQPQGKKINLMLAAKMVQSPMLEFYRKKKCLFLKSLWIHLANHSCILVQI